MEQRIALDISDFRELREKECVYVDKTGLLQALIRDKTRKLYFISRPRRFGKSLMLSTLECIFRGERDLFKGLAIDSLDYDWAKYPIIRFDLSVLSETTLESFRSDLRKTVRDALLDAGALWDETDSTHRNFGSAIDWLAAKHKSPVVVLIDEYDAPVTRAMGDIAKATAIRSELSPLYSQLKAHGVNIRFMMMTGVTKFAQLSVFSALNNLNDLTLQPEAATLLGYSDEELDANFAPSLQAHAKVMGLSDTDYRAELRRWYNGYRFSPDCTTTVYNPVAIARILSRKKPYFETTWSETGHASALMRYLERENLVDKDYDRLPLVSKSIFDNYNLGTLRPETVLYQAGYLTIKDFIPPKFYALGVPDEDVRQDLNSLLLRRRPPGPRPRRPRRRVYGPGLRLRAQDSRHRRRGPRPNQGQRLRQTLPSPRQDHPPHRPGLRPRLQHPHRRHRGNPHARHITQAAASLRLHHWRAFFTPDSTEILAALQDARTPLDLLILRR